MTYVIWKRGAPMTARVVKGRLRLFWAALWLAPADFASIFNRELDGLSAQQIAQIWTELHDA